MLDVFIAVRPGLYNPEEGRLIERGKLQASALARELRQYLGNREPLILFSKPAVERYRNKRVEITASKETALIIAHAFRMGVNDCYRLPRGREDQLDRVLEYITRRADTKHKRVAITITRQERAMSLMAGMVALLGERRAIVPPANGQALILTVETREIELFVPRMTVFG